MPVARYAMEITELGHWQRTLGRHVRFLRRAGVTSAQIEREIARYLARCLNIRELPVPAAVESTYPRILTHWRHESAYLDNRGQPRALRFEGHSPTFRSLVRAAVPGADASKVLIAMKRCRLVSQSAHGIVRLLANGPFQRGMQQGSLLGVTLASLDALTDTCYVDLCAGQTTRSGSGLQGRAFTEHLDRRHLRAYEEFLNESAQVFLAMHETWLKRHEVKKVGPRRIRRVGVGVYAIRGH